MSWHLLSLIPTQDISDALAHVSDDLATKEKCTADEVIVVDEKKVRTHRLLAEFSILIEDISAFVLHLFLFGIVIYFSRTIYALLVQEDALQEDTDTSVPVPDATVPDEKEVRAGVRSS